MVNWMRGSVWCSESSQRGVFDGIVTSLCLELWNNVVIAETELFVTFLPLKACFGWFSAALRVCRWV